MDNYKFRLRKFTEKIILAMSAYLFLNTFFRSIKSFSEAAGELDCPDAFYKRIAFRTPAVFYAIG